MPKFYLHVPQCHDSHNNVTIRDHCIYCMRHKLRVTDLNVLLSRDGYLVLTYCQIKALTNTKDDSKVSRTTPSSIYPLQITSKWTYSI